jgi:uncharacterized protein YcbK (DUF882 family)
MNACASGRVTRRALLKTLAAVLASLSLPRRSAAWESRRLRLRNTHTDEYIDVTYFENGGYLPDALAELDRFLRDFRTGDVHRIDPDVLDVASRIASAAGRPLGTFEVISGYRSPRTNALLHERSSGVAAHSMHLQGRALDLRMPGVPTMQLRDIALALRRGGVGYYATSDFVHVDTGRVRTW